MGSKTVVQDRMAVAAVKEKEAGNELVQQAAAGLPDNVFVQITVETQTKEKLADFEIKVRECPQIMECYLMSGDADYLLRVVVSDASDYERLHMDVLTALPGVSQVKSNFSLRTVTKKTSIPFRKV